MARATPGYPLSKGEKKPRARDDRLLHRTHGAIALLPLLHTPSPLPHEQLSRVMKSKGEIQLRI